MDSNTIEVGQVVRAIDWPGRKGARFLVTALDKTPSGKVAHLLEFDGGTPWKYTCILRANLRVDIQATRERARRLAAIQEAAEAKRKTAESV